MYVGTILLAERDRTLRTALSNALEREGFSVMETGNAWEALEIFDADIPVDLVIADLGIPGRDDDFVAARFRCRTRGVPVLYTSGHTRNEARRRFDFPREASFIPKPFSIEELLLRVDAFIPRSQAEAATAPRIRTSGLPPRPRRPLPRAPTAG